MRAHLDLCDACRLDQALTSRLAAGLIAGRLELPRTSGRVIRPRAWWQRPAALAGTGSALIAACLTLLMLLPPPSTIDRVHLRGGPQDPHFLRPVEGEVVHPPNAVLSWTPVDGATSYRITLTGVDMDFTWEGTTPDTEFKLPALDLASGTQTLRAVLTTVPSDLVPAGQISVSFQTGSRTQVARDRLIKAPLWLSLLGIFGFVSLGLSVWSLDRRTRALADV